MWMRAAALVFTGLLAAWIITQSRPRNALVPLILSGLNGVPLFMLGNSANGSIFSVDVALVVFVLRFGLSDGRHMVWWAGRTGVLITFLILVLWTTASSAIACLTEPALGKFAAYGTARWWMFLVMVVAFFGQRLSEEEWIRQLRRLALILAPYAFLCLAHQYGVVDLAADETLGDRAAEAIEAQRDSQDTDLAAGHRRFLGMTSANIGSVCALGAWVPLVLWARTRRGSYVWLPLAIVMCMALVGTWSRSNVLGMGAALAVGIGFYLRFLTGTGRLAIGAVALGVAAAALMFYMTTPGSLATPTLDRYVGALSEYSRQGDGTGGHRYREHQAILNYLLDHPHVAVFGLGANGYRRLMWCGAASMMFGHNAFLHTIYELGAPGLVLLGLWLWRIARPGMPADATDRASGRSQGHETGVLILTLVVQRLAAGWGADTLFATEGMLQANVLFIALAGMAYSSRNVIMPAGTREPAGCCLSVQAA